MIEEAKLLFLEAEEYLAKSEIAEFKGVKTVLDNLNIINSFQLHAESSDDDEGGNYYVFYLTKINNYEMYLHIEDLKYELERADFWTEENKELFFKDKIKQQELEADLKSLCDAFCAIKESTLLQLAFNKPIESDFIQIKIDSLNKPIS